METTTYSEKVKEVADLPEGMTKDTVTLTDVLEGTISMEQFVASLSVEEMAKLVNGSSTKSVGYIYDEDGNIIPTDTIDDLWNLVKDYQK